MGMALAPAVKAFEMAGRSVSRILSGAPAAAPTNSVGAQTARQGDHSSGPDVAIGIKRPTRGS